MDCVGYGGSHSHHALLVFAVPMILNIEHLGNSPLCGKHLLGPRNRAVGTIPV